MSRRLESHSLRLSYGKGHRNPSLGEYWRDLGVTLLAITSIGEDSQYVLDAAAQSAAAACFVEELCDSMAGVGPTRG